VLAAENRTHAFILENNPLASTKAEQAVRYAALNWYCLRLSMEIIPLRVWKKAPSTQLRAMGMPGTLRATVNATSLLKIIAASQNGELRRHRDVTELF